MKSLQNETQSNNKIENDSITHDNLYNKKLEYIINSTEI